MGKINKLLLLLSLSILIFGVSCSKYEKLLKSSDNEAKYQAALKYYERGKYKRATPLFDALVLANRGTPRDDTTNFYMAKSYYLDKDPFTAEYYFGSFKNTFPRSPFAEEAAYLQGVCLYDASYRSELDQTPTQRTLAIFAEFNYTYPHSEWKEDVQLMTDDLANRLIVKTFNSGKFYYKVEDYKAAIVTLKNSLKDYPDSQYREEALYLILRSNYLYASNSIRDKQLERYQQTVDEYFNFISEYPESKYVKSAKDMYDKALEGISADRGKITRKEYKEEKEIEKSLE
ncbi:MAG: outer membrane protein assembly factor BamD [Prevotellaceae bacterium]|jgi:outer membrane protein assembly factor BamD|nr:outer membrane protein assembly factor BamD [Prevotellaceae bacterium]